jgi:hypothetical protein
MFTGWLKIMSSGGLAVGIRCVENSSSVII